MNLHFDPPRLRLEAQLGAHDHLRVLYAHLRELTACIRGQFAVQRPRTPSVRAMPRRVTGAPPRSWLRDAEERDRTPNGWRNSPFGQHDLQPQHWKIPTSPDQELDLAAARYHHSVAQHLNWAIDRSGKTVKQVASEIGMSTDGLYRVLNGSHHMYVTDLVRIAIACGRTPAFTLRRKSEDGDLQPKARSKESG